MKTRIISAIVAAIILVPLFIIGGYPFIIGMSILAILGYKEMMDLKKSHKEYPNLMLLLGLICLIVIMLSNLQSFSITYGITYQRLLLTMLLLITPVIFYKNDEYTTKDAFYLLGVTLFLGLVFNLIIVLRNRGIYLLLYLVMIPIVTDTFAYCGGLLCGKHKMCPKISPKKSWEGAIIGLVFGTIIGVIIYSCLVDAFSFRIILLTAILSVMGQIGDLVMSKIKRENDIKDFSNIMPGHGGVLDRLDSTIFVLLTYVTFLFLV